MVAEEFQCSGIRVLRGAVDPELCAAVVDSLGPGSSRLPGGVSRLQDAWRYSCAVRDLASHPQVLDELTHLYGRRPVPFQTLDFDAGTEQRFHADSIHFDSVPHGWMCGVWVALEDVGVDQGPLTVVPASHRVTSGAAESARRSDGGFDMEAYEQRLAAELAGLDEFFFTAATGDVLIWHADIAHGGAPVRDRSTTRWSQVTHYFFEGFTHVTPMLGTADGSEVYLREPVVDITSGRSLRPMSGDRPARLLRVGNGRARILAEDAPDPARWERVISGARGVVRRSRHRTRWLGDRVRGHATLGAQRIQSATAVASPSAKRR